MSPKNMHLKVALLRGINVGGANLVKMTALKEFMSEFGFQNPKTLLQSGNVVFEGEGSNEEIEAMLEKEAKASLGISPKFFVRSKEEWGHMISQNPFPEAAAADPGHLVVIFLKRQADAAAVAAVQSAVKGPEVIKPFGNHLFITYPEGIGTSKLPTTPGWTQLTASGTGRNWNTILKLGSLLGG